jgi:hypothetical protein
MPQVHQFELNTDGDGTTGATLLQLPPGILIGPLGLVAVGGITADTAEVNADGAALI